MAILNKKTTFETRYSNFLEQEDFSRLSNTRLINSIFKLSQALGSQYQSILNHCEKCLLLLFNPQVRDYASAKVNLLEYITLSILDRGEETEFLYLVHWVYYQIAERKDLRFFINIFRELNDIWDYFYFESGQSIIGLKEGKFLLAPRPFFQELCDMENKSYKFNQNKLGKQARKEFLSNLKRGSILAKMDIRVSKSRVIMAYFVREKDLWMFPDPSLAIDRNKSIKGGINVVSGGSVENELSDESQLVLVLERPPGDYSKRLENRHSRLKPEGIRIDFEGRIFLDHMFLKEILGEDGRPYVIISAKISGAELYACGVIDIMEKKVIHDLSDEDPEVHEIVSGIFLEVYTMLTCESSGLAPRIFPLSSIEGNPGSIYYSIQTKDGTGITRSKRKKSTQVSHTRTYTTRKLPEGWKVSEAAKEKAAMMGITLLPGETFVPEYEVGRVDVTEPLPKKRGRPRKEVTN